MPLHRIAVALGLLVVGTCARADPDAAAEPLWELGGVAFGVSQQAYPGAEDRGADISAIFRGRPTTLHEIWDSGLLAARPDSWA